MVKRNMAKVHHALTYLGEVLNGLSRGLDLSIIDRGFGEQFGTRLSFFPATATLGLVMPSNSPAVNSLWLPAIALKMADFIDAQIEDGLKTAGATDVTAKYRGSEVRSSAFTRPGPPEGGTPNGGGSRKAVFDGGVYLRPTIVQCDSFAHPLANKEFLCPYASVVTCPQDELLKQIGYRLACTAITKDAEFIRQIEAYPHIERLNIGPVSTMKISWDQPHEGNMFEFLWQRRSIERAW